MCASLPFTCISSTLLPISMLAAAATDAVVVVLLFVLILHFFRFDRTIKTPPKSKWKYRLICQMWVDYMLWRRYVVVEGKGKTTTILQHTLTTNLPHKPCCVFAHSVTLTLSALSKKKTFLFSTHRSVAPHFTVIYPVQHQRICSILFVFSINFVLAIGELCKILRYKYA